MTVRIEQTFAAARCQTRHQFGSAPARVGRTNRSLTPSLKGPTPMAIYSLPQPIEFDRNNQRREDGLSTSLQLSKASEHLACAELILQGFNAFIVDAGLPYDILADRG